MRGARVDEIALALAPLFDEAEEPPRHGMGYSDQYFDPRVVAE